MLAGLIVIGTSSSAYAAQLDATINPQGDQSPFQMKYQKTVFIEYPQGGQLFDLLQGEEWRLSGSADSSVCRLRPSDTPPGRGHESRSP